MFGLLNTTTDLRKYSPLVCKFLDLLSSLFHGLQRRCRGSSYLLEKTGLRDGEFPAFGFGIALTLRQPVLMRIRSGKD